MPKRLLHATKIRDLKLHLAARSGVTRGVTGSQFAGCRITAGGAEKSQQCHKYFLQYSTFTFEKPQVRTQTCF